MCIRDRSNTIPNITLTRKLLIGAINAKTNNPQNKKFKKLLIRLYLFRISFAISKLLKSNNSFLCIIMSQVIDKEVTTEAKKKKIKNKLYLAEPSSNITGFNILNIVGYPKIKV